MFSKKKFIRRLSIIIAAMIILSTGLLAGCTAKEANESIDNNNINEQSKNAQQEDIQGKVMADFDQLLGNSPKADAVIDFIDENIAKLTKENASIMLSRLEEVQKKQLPALEEKYYSTDAIQTELQTIYKPGFDLNNLGEIKDQQLKDLLTETMESGYKIETAEGMFFPVINYEFYKKYSNNVTEDIKEYIDIMAVESNVTPVKDAGLMIGWNEIIKRALAQEHFIKNYESSAKADEVSKLQKRYITFMLFGTNNTPLFSYDTNVMMAEAQEIYSKAIKDNQDSEIIQMLSKYMDILRKTDYKFSDEADKFRKDVTGNNML